MSAFARMAALGEQVPLRNKTDYRLRRNDCLLEVEKRVTNIVRTKSEIVLAFRLQVSNLHLLVKFFTST